MEFKEFEQIILNVKKSWERVGTLSDVTKCDMFVDLAGPLIDEVVDLLEYIFEDENSWIAYWMFDLNFGENYVPGKVLENGKEVPLKTIEDLWDILQ